jgi:hypothetical protein
MWGRDEYSASSITYIDDDTMLLGVRMMLGRWISVR